MLVMLAKEKLVGHAGDVIADNHMPRFNLRELFVGSGHRAGRSKVVVEKLLEGAHRAVAVLGDGGVIVDVGEEKALKLGVVSSGRFTEAREAI